MSVPARNATRPIRITDDHWRRIKHGLLEVENACTAFRAWCGAAVRVQYIEHESFREKKIQLLFKTDLSTDIARFAQKWTYHSSIGNDWIKALQHTQKMPSQHAKLGRHDITQKESSQSTNTHHVRSEKEAAWNVRKCPRKFILVAVPLKVNEALCFGENQSKIHEQCICFVTLHLSQQTRRDFHGF